MIREKQYMKYEIFVAVSAIFTAFLGFISDKEKGYELIFLIPLIYVFLFIFNKWMHKYSKTHYGMLILNVILYIKYVVAIFFIIINKDYGNAVYTGKVPSSESCTQAIIYILVEMIFIFGMIFIFAKMLYKSDSIRNDKNDFSKIEINIVLIGFLLIIGMIAVINFNIFMPTQALFINSEYAMEKKGIEGSIEVAFFSFKTILMGIAINHCILKYQKNEKMRYVIYSYIIILVYVIFNTSTSRLNMIIPIIFFVLITQKIFNKKGKILLGIVIGILILSFSSITVYKSAWLFTDDTYNLLDIAKVITNQIQEYTSGIRPVAQGIEAIEQYRDDITFSTLVNDIFGSIPIINSAFNNKDRINIYYNMYILGNSTEIHPLIMPLVTISKAYFSSIFCWLFTSLNILLMMYFDGKINKYKKNYLSTYVMIYLSFIFASSVYANTQIVIGRIFTKFIPVVLIIYINNKIALRKEKNE